jgi:DNA-binding transcriptional MocR family regulator
MHAFFKITEALAENKTLSSTTKLVLARLIRHCNLQTGQCNPKIATLARELGLSKITIQRTVARLRTLGWIQTRRGQRGLCFAILSDHLDTSEPILSDHLDTSRDIKMIHQNASILYMNRTRGIERGSVPVGDAAALPPQSKNKTQRKPPRSVLDIFYEHYATEEQRKARPKS